MENYSELYSSASSSGNNLFGVTRLKYINIIHVLIYIIDLGLNYLAVIYERRLCRLYN